MLCVIWPEGGLAVHSAAPPWVMVAGVQLRLPAGLVVMAWALGTQTTCTLVTLALALPLPLVTVQVRPGGCVSTVTL